MAYLLVDAMRISWGGEIETPCGKALEPVYTWMCPKPTDHYGRVDVSRAYARVDVSRAYARVVVSRAYAGVDVSRAYGCVDVPGRLVDSAAIT